MRVVCQKVCHFVERYSRSYGGVVVACSCGCRSPCGRHLVHKRHACAALTIREERLEMNGWIIPLEELNESHGLMEKWKVLVRLDLKIGKMSDDRHDVLFQEGTNDGNVLKTEIECKLYTLLPPPPPPPPPLFFSLSPPPSCLSPGDRSLSLALSGYCQCW